MKLGKKQKITQSKKKEENTEDKNRNQNEVENRKSTKKSWFIIKINKIDKLLARQK